jgi:uncharacterized coiled-coil protein SlyX
MPAPKKAVGGNTLYDEESLQITGPMHVMQAIMVHEQRLNKIDTRLGQQQAFIQPSTLASLPEQTCDSQACDAECYDRLSALEEKVQMLEEVIMNLQLTLTNVQSFAMETSLAMLKLQNQVSATPAPAVVSAPATPVTTTHVTTMPVPATPAPVPSVESAPPTESSED